MYECEGFRLPTDAEWEYAARAGTETAFYSGAIAAPSRFGECEPDSQLDPIAWYCANARGSTHPVAGKRANGWGLHDMLGNASEWTNDVSTGLPPDRALDPGGEIGSSPARVHRGGLFNAFSSLCRSASHLTGSWGARGPGLGVRLVRTLR